MRRLLSLLFTLVALLGLATGPTSVLARKGDEFLPPEQAFAVSARMAAAGSAEVQVVVAPGYYLYREPFKFSAQGATLGAPVIPAGKVKFDENFNKDVETYRGTLRIPLPVTGSGRFTLEVVSQGCADAGLCYPPMTTHIALDTGVLQPASALPAGAERGGSGGGSSSGWFDRLQSGNFAEQVLDAGRLGPVAAAFFVLGLLLAFTPCVLPMLPILSSLIVGSGAGAATPSRGRGLALASAYSLGMALVYTGLGVAAGLAGEGLAAALQTPWMIGAFALLLALFALAMFDVYELRLPQALTERLTAQSNRLPAGQLAGVFAMGGVSALIVSPCVSAPLAGALLFISRSRDVVLGGAALFALAAGMSVPLLLLGASAGRWLPRSGAWMTAVKRFFGLLMLAVAVWIAQPVLPARGVLLAWGALALLAAALLRPWSARPAGSWQWPRRALGVLALSVAASQVVGAATGALDPLRPLAQLGRGGAARGAAVALPFKTIHSSAEFDAALREAGAAGRPLMLDFYADWCVSCKEMERFTFSDAAVAGRLKSALLLKADVTANTEDERALLRRFKLFGPPGTLFFDTQGREQADARVVGFQGPERFLRTLDDAGLR